MAAMFCLFCEPCEDSANWLGEFLGTKAVAALLGAAMWRLYEIKGSVCHRINKIFPLLKS